MEKQESNPHTGQPDCPECARIEAELSALDSENEELVNVLMEQWDGMIQRMATNLEGFLKRKGREAVLHGVKRLAVLQGDKKS